MALIVDIKVGDVLMVQVPENLPLQLLKIRIDEKHGRLVRLSVDADECIKIGRNKLTKKPKDVNKLEKGAGFVV